MNLRLLNTTELMIYNEGVRDGAAALATEKEDKMSTEVDLMRDAEEVGYQRGLQEASVSPVKEFHEVFGHPVKTIPEVPDLETRMLRVKLLLEEVLEFAEASGIRVILSRSEPDRFVTLPGEPTMIEVLGMPDDAPDIVEAADALADIRYVTDGALLCWGLDGPKLLAEVHRSNMSKLGEGGMPIIRGDGKIMKGPNFTLPDISRILIEAGWRGEER